MSDLSVTYEQRLSLSGGADNTATPKRYAIVNRHFRQGRIQRVGQPHRMSKIGCIPPFTPLFSESAQVLELDAAEPMQRLTDSSAVCLYGVLLDSTRQRKLNPL